MNRKSKFVDFLRDCASFKTLARNAKYKKVKPAEKNAY